MSVTIPTTSIRSRGIGAPVHTAVAGAWYMDTSNGEVYTQTALPTGSVWEPVKPPGAISYVPYREAHTGVGYVSFERV